MQTLKLNSEVLRNRKGLDSPGFLAHHGFMNLRYTLPDNDDGSPLTEEAKLDFCLAKFREEFPSAKHCIDGVFNALHKDGPECPHCGSSDIHRVSGERFMHCRSCKKKIWFMVGTAFECTHLLLPRFGYIMILSNGLSISKEEFYKRFDIDKKTATKIFHELTAIIEIFMQEEMFCVPSLAFIDSFLRRSRVTEARKPPSSEQEEMERWVEESWKGQAGERVDVEISPSMREDAMADLQPESARHEEQVETLMIVEAQREGESQPSESNEKVYAALSDEPVYVEELLQKTGMALSEVNATLTMLELAGLVKQLFGNQYVRVIPGWTAAVSGSSGAGTSWARRAMEAVMDFMEFIAKTFRGISRKYLQRYLAYWWYIRRAGEHSESLLDQCLSVGPIRDEDIRSYVSPLMVKSFLKHEAA